MRRLRGETATATRFGLVGLGATAVHLQVAYLAALLLPAASPFIVNALGFLAAFQLSLYGHRHYTFRRRGSARRFLLVALAGFLLNNGLLGSLLLGTRLSDYAAIALATLAVPLLTYLAARLWAFRRRPPANTCALRQRFGERSRGRG